MTRITGIRRKLNSTPEEYEEHQLERIVEFMNDPPEHGFNGTWGLHLAPALFEYIKLLTQRVKELEEKDNDR